MKSKFAAWLIPDEGDALMTRSFTNAVDCQSHARLEADQLFRNTACGQVEIVVCESNLAVVGMSEIVRRRRCISCGTNGAHYCPADVARS